jgi:hypothetical protein
VIITNQQIFNHFKQQHQSLPFVEIRANVAIDITKSSTGPPGGTFHSQLYFNFIKTDDPSRRAVVTRL